MAPHGPALVTAAGPLRAQPLHNRTTSPLSTQYLRLF